jgi:hypothetical protein
MRSHVLLSKINIPGPMSRFAFAQWARSICPALKILLAGTADRMGQNAAELCEHWSRGRHYEQALTLQRLKRLTVDEVAGPTPGSCANVGRR